MVLPFVVNGTNVYGSDDLGITEAGCKQNIPDGIYCLEYTIEINELIPPTTISVKKTILRTANLQEKFNEAFLKLDLMQCDGELAKQTSVNLNTINFFIQGAIAAANNCADKEAMRLYDQANKMLHMAQCANCGAKVGCGCQLTNGLCTYCNGSKK